MRHSLLFFFLLTPFASACRSETREDQRRAAAATATVDSAHVTSHDTAAHAGHVQTAEQEQHGTHVEGASATRHAAHTPGAPATQHTQHRPGTRVTQHAQHTAAKLGPVHVQHDTTKRVAGHAQHDTTRRADFHAQHDTTRKTDQHAQHDTTRQADHAEHAATDTAKHQQHAAQEQHADMQSSMIMAQLGSFSLMAMGQVFPTFSFALPGDEGTPLERTGLYLTQPAIMANLSSRESRFVLRTTLNFEGITQPDGELTFGAWGEGFIDKRHPHTLLHEFMLSHNIWRGSNAFSISAGKGFAPYGTDDPMSRPVVKYPTNHHLSQALERFTIIGTALVGKWSLEASVFGGNEPTGPYDFGNIEPFANSWSARAARRFGTGQMGTWPVELSASYASVVETHDDESESTRLFNAAVRHEDDHGKAHHYTMVEFSRSTSEHDESYYSLLGEASVRIGANLPYARVEYATRPEYAREGARTSDEFFRYHHDDEPIGTTRWLIASAGYGRTLFFGKVSPRPYAEFQYNKVWHERGAVDPEALFGRTSFWSISAGVRIFVGGEPMRMGSYGVLDPMTAMHQEPTMHHMSTHRH